MRSLWTSCCHIWSDIQLPNGRHQLLPQLRWEPAQLISQLLCSCKSNFPTIHIQGQTITAEWSFLPSRSHGINKVGKDLQKHQSQLPTQHHVLHWNVSSIASTHDFWTIPGMVALPHFWAVCRNTEEKMSSVLAVLTRNGKHNQVLRSSKGQALSCHLCPPKGQQEVWKRK